MADHHTPVSVDPATLAHAEHVWHNFGQAMKLAVIIVAPLLIVMAAAFIDW